MTSAELFGEGINLMFSGMGFVLVFLLILIWAIGLMSKLINKYFPEPQPSPKTPSNSTALSAAPTDDFERLMLTNRFSRPVYVLMTCCRSHKN